MSKLPNLRPNVQLDLFPAESETPLLRPERWLSVGGWPGYEVSDHGRLRSYRGSGSVPGKDRKIPIIIGGYLQKRRAKIVSVQVCLYRTTADGVRETWRNGIHILVLTAFVGPCPPGLQGCHKNSDPTDNHVDNLRWGTPASNKLDLLWREDSQFKLSNEDVRAIWVRLLAGERDYLIAKDYGVTNAVITGIKMGDHWTHVTKDLPGFPLVTMARTVADREPVRILAEFADSPIEIWRLIPGYPYYRVSTFGQIESCRKRAMRKSPSEGIADTDWRPMSPGVGKYGHLKITVRNHPREKKSLSVHVAVLLAFAGPCPPGMIGCHDDGDHSNNHARNIRWDSHKANKADALRHAAEKATTTGETRVRA
jgi:hypothetical protein